MLKKGYFSVTFLRGDLECVRWLIGNGADLQAEDNFGRTPEHLAREYGHDIVADLLRVSERDLKDPNSSLAQMHRAMQRKYVSTKVSNISCCMQLYSSAYV